MSRTRGRDGRAELAVRRVLHRRGFRYRVDRPVMRGVRRRADIVFSAARVVVLIDGCFWHGCPIHASWPKHNAGFWREKIAANRSRDRDTDRRLAAEGWQVVRVWEHENPELAATRIAAVIRARTNS